MIGIKVNKTTIAVIKTVIVYTIIIIVLIFRFMVNNSPTDVYRWVGHNFGKCTYSKCIDCHDKL